MNEELQNAVGKILEKTVSGIDTASTFLLAELPDVVQQLLLWHGVKSALISFLCIVALIVIAKLDIKIGKQVSTEEGYSSQDFVIGYVFFGSIVRAVAYLPFLSNISLDWLQIWLAPKVWLIEYSANLVR